MRVWWMAVGKEGGKERRTRSSESKGLGMWAVGVNAEVSCKC